MFKSVITLALFGALSTSAFAHDFSVGDLEIENPVARATVPGARVGGGYLVITNTGDAEDRLIGGTAVFAGKVEIHEMKMKDSVMTMKPIEDGLVIPPGDTVRLAPGGNHVMFMKLNQALNEGDQKKVTLQFEKAGAVEVTFNVVSIAESMKLREKMKHSN